LETEKQELSRSVNCTSQTFWSFNTGPSNLFLSDITGAGKWQGTLSCVSHSPSSPSLLPLHEGF
jgi:hypothetical protein